MHDHGARFRGEAARKGGVGAVPAHEPFHRGRGAVRRGGFRPLILSRIAIVEVRNTSAVSSTKIRGIFLS